MQTAYPVPNHRRNHRVLAVMKRSKQHPLVKEIVDRCRRKGAAIYEGRNFVVAKWENGRK